MLNNKTFLRIFSLVAAVLLWMYVMGEVDPTKTSVVSNITVSFMNSDVLAEEGLAPIENENMQISAKIKGKRSLVNDVKRNGMSAYVDVSSCKEGKNTVEVKTERLFTYGWLVIFIGCMLSVFQQIVGINAVLYYAPRIFDSVGAGDSMQQTVIMGVVNITFTLVAVFTVERLGRKPLLITGSLGMALGALCFAACNAFSLPPMMQVLSIMVYSASFMFSWGPICWVLISEIFPNTIRGAAVAIAVAFQWIFNFIVSASFVPMYNMEITPGDGFGHTFAYALYGVIGIIAAIFVWRLVPETKGKTLEEMNKLWSKK